MRAFLSRMPSVNVSLVCSLRGVKTESRFLRTLYASLSWFCVVTRFLYVIHAEICVNATPQHNKVVLSSEFVCVHLSAGRRKEEKRGRGEETRRRTQTPGGAGANQGRRGSPAETRAGMTDMRYPSSFLEVCSKLSCLLFWSEGGKAKSQEVGRGEEAAGGRTERGGAKAQRRIGTHASAAESGERTQRTGTRGAGACASQGDLHELEASARGGEEERDGGEAEGGRGVAPAGESRQGTRAAA